MDQFVLGAEDGSIYVVTADGDLLWYKDERRNGTAGWHPNSGNRIGWGWERCRFVFGGPDGVIYAIDHAGDLLWFRDEHRDGTMGWAPGSGQKIGNGWGNFRAFAAPGGIIYGIRDDGALFWYKDVHRNGTPGWAAGSGGQIGSGWNEVRIGFASADGVVYAVKHNGDLHWYRDAHGNGTQGWAANSGNRIGSGWGICPHAFPGATGVIYGIDSHGLLRWYRDVPRNGTPGWAERSGDAIGNGWLGAEWNPSLRDFGHGKLVTDGKPALGPRRLIVILAEYSDNAAGDFPTFASIHSDGYYDNLAFGLPSPPFTTSNPVNPASLKAYFQECSLGRFWLDAGGVIGPLPMGPLGQDPGPEVRAQRIIDKAGDANLGLFFLADADGNDLVTSSEVVVLIFENIKALQPANRVNAPVQFTMDRPSGPVTKVIHLKVAIAGPLTPFYQIAHEVSHCFGTFDMYNSGAGNALLTLMGAYPFFSNDQGIVHLDAWHKLALGWCEPRRRRVTRPGSEILLATTAEQPSAPIILWHPQRSSSEYFIVERRRRNGAGFAYEGSLPDEGALLWHVAEGASTPATHLGSPNLAVGGNTVWRPGTTTPPLRWNDGTEVGISLTFEGLPGPGFPEVPTMRVRW